MRASAAFLLGLALAATIPAGAAEVQIICHPTVVTPPSCALTYNPLPLGCRTT